MWNQLYYFVHLQLLLDQILLLCLFHLFGYQFIDGISIKSSQFYVDLQRNYTVLNVSYTHMNKNIENAQCKIAKLRGSHAAHQRCAVVRPIQKSIGKWKIRPPAQSSDS